MSPKKKIFIITVPLILLLLGVFLLNAVQISDQQKDIYTSRNSVEIRDKNNDFLSLDPNILSYYARYKDDYPKNLKEKVLNQEDKYFYYHLGINPISSLRAFYHLLTGDKNLSNSTITQQLSKVLLSNTGERTFINKLKESFYAVSLELFTDKEEILNMYLNSVYLGNRIQGFNEASRFYYDTDIRNLPEPKLTQMISKLNSPSKQTNLLFKEKKDEFLRTSFFELKDLDFSCDYDCALTIDSKITEKIRTILKEKTTQYGKYGAKNGVVIVINPKDNTLLALVGSPNPKSTEKGFQINMTTRPRAIGSTIKPFIYLKGFEKGLRPYTLIDDREYKYTIESGFDFFPKNYDYKYNGIVTLYHSLANSLNVPALKVLEYVPISSFNQFLKKDLLFKPVQPLENYGLGIALGQLEMSPLNLAYYFTAFSNDGKIKPLKICQKNCTSNLPDYYNLDKQIASPVYFQLINKILSDSQSKADQYGITNNLYTPYGKMAVKTGTSRDYHDSWTVGYSPNLLVLTWIGNTEDKPMDAVSGALGAGDLWLSTVNMIISEKNLKLEPFKDDLIKKFETDKGQTYGQNNDNFEERKNILLNIDTEIIRTPHDQDHFLLTPDMEIPLRAKMEVEWFLNGISLGTSEEKSFSPTEARQYEIRAQGKEGEQQSLSIFIDRE